MSKHRSQKWMLFEEEKPLNSGEYLVIIKDAELPTILTYDPIERIWLDENDNFYSVTWWMSLPDHPTGRQKLGSDINEQCKDLEEFKKFTCLLIRQRNLYERQKNALEMICKEKRNATALDILSRVYWTCFADEEVDTFLLLRFDGLLEDISEEYGIDTEAIYLYGESEDPF